MLSAGLKGYQVVCGRVMPGVGQLRYVKKDCDCMRYIIRLASALSACLLGVAAATLWNSLGGDPTLNLAPPVVEGSPAYERPLTGSVSLRLLTRPDGSGMFSLYNGTAKPIWVLAQKSEFRGPDDSLLMVFYSKREAGTDSYRLINDFGCVIPQRTLRIIPPHQSVWFERGHNADPGDYKIVTGYTDDPGAAKPLFDERKYSKREEERIRGAWKDLSYEFAISTEPKR
jgi:hypothetical protein